MNFEFSTEQRLLQESVREFVAREVRPAAREIDESEEFPWKLFRRCADLGFFRLRYPEGIGGLGGDPLSFILMMEELAAGSLALASIVGMQALNSTELLYRLGTEAHKERLLLPALAGEKIGTIAITEPDAGSDISGIRTYAKRDGDGWRISGSKTWITSAPAADFFIVAAKTNPEMGGRGIDIFVVERKIEGLSIGRAIEKLGTHGSATSEVFFENVYVSGDSMLGTPGTGMQHLRRILGEVRAMTGAMALGLGRAALEDALRYAQERRQFGRPIGSFQAISHKLASMGTQLEAARWLVYRAGWEIAFGEPDGKLGAMAKLFATEMANRLADETTRIFGSYGYSMEYDAQRYFRDARFLLYAAGTSEILLGVIAKRMGV